MYHFVINLSLKFKFNFYIYESSTPSLSHFFISNIWKWMFKLQTIQTFNSRCCNKSEAMLLFISYIYSCLVQCLSDLWTANPQTSSNWSCLHLPLSRYNRNNVTKYFIPWNPTKLLTLTKTKIIPTGRIVSTSIYKIAEPRKYDWHV